MTIIKSSAHDDNQFLEDREDKREKKTLLEDSRS